jgi:hypothetical protein
MKYPVAYYLSVAVFVVAAICGALVGADKAGFHPSWLTADVVQTAGILGLILAPIAGLLPSLTRTPAARETKYLNARIGYLPHDLAQKYPEAHAR